MSRRTLFFALAGLATLAAGCAKPPMAEIESKKQLVQTSIAQSEATSYAPQAARALQDSLAVIDDLVVQQSRRLPFLRKYNHIPARLGNLDGGVRAMVAEAQKNKAAAHAEAASRIELATATADSAEAEFRGAPRGKGGQAALDTLHQDLSAARDDLAQASASLDSKPAQAREQADAAAEKAARVLADLRAAKAKMHSGRARAAAAARTASAERAARAARSARATAAAQASAIAEHSRP